MILGRRHFRDVVSRQLDLFAEDEAELLADAEMADAAWTEAAAEDTEELYGDFQLVVDSIGERLYEIREMYARTLAVEAAGEYRVEFDRASRKRFDRLASFLEGDT